MLTLAPMTAYVIGNWKMNGSAALARTLSDAAVAAAREAGPDVQVALCPPAVYLAEVARHISGSPVALGAQDCHAEAKGAFTGDLAAPMLQEAGCSYVIVGHSERRAQHAETDAQVRAKASAALSAGLTPIICVGEALEVRQEGRAEAAVEAQLRASMPLEGKFILAYEPIWAIGTGLAATPEDIAAMHRHLSGIAGNRVPVLYGGSVKADNASRIMSLPNVSGVLVGGASVVAEEFVTIIHAGRARAATA